MAEIGQQVFAIDGTRNFLRLYKEEFVRSFIVPPYLARMRVALMVQITDSGGSFTSPSDSFIGFCQGTARPYASGSGLRVYGVGLRTSWTYTGGAAPYYSGVTGDALSIINGSRNSNSLTSTTAAFATTGGTPRRCVMMAEIVNGSSIYFRTGTVASAANDFTFFNFLEATEARTPSFANNTVTCLSFSANPVASTSLLDTVNIFWSNPSVPLIIYGIAVYTWMN